MLLTWDIICLHLETHCVKFNFEGHFQTNYLLKKVGVCVEGPGSFIQDKAPVHRGEKLENKEIGIKIPNQQTFAQLPHISND